LLKRNTEKMSEEKKTASEKMKEWIMNDPARKLRIARQEAEERIRKSKYEHKNDKQTR